MNRPAALLAACVVACVSPRAQAQASPGIQLVADLPQGGQITGHALSPDGRRIAAVVLATRLRVSNADSGRADWELAANQHNSEYFSQPVFSPDGNLLAVESAGEVALFHADGTLLARLGGHQPAQTRQGRDPVRILGVRFDADSRTVMTYTRMKAMLFRVNEFADAGWLRRQFIKYRGAASLGPATTLLPRDAPPGGGPFEFHEVLYAQNGKELLGSSTTHVHVWSVGTGRELRATELDGLAVRPGFLSSDGRHVAVCWPDAVALGVLDRSRPALELKREHGQHLAQGANCAFSPDGRFILSWQSSYPMFNLHVWDMNGRELMGYRDKPGDRLSGVAFSGDGKRLVAIDELGIVRVFDLDHGTLVARREGEYSMIGVTRSPADYPRSIPISTDRSGRRVVVQERERLRVFDVAAR